MTAPISFEAALIRLYGAEVLVVIVARHILDDASEGPLVVAAFHARYRRTIVLAALDPRGVPTYFGPEAIARVLAGIPFDALSWRRYRYRQKVPAMLPIPVEESDARDSQPSFLFSETTNTHRGADSSAARPTRGLRRSSQPTRALRK